ncbi:hypothetical protein ACFQ7Z_21970 [Streptomyces virginiae]|uniref:hypothetical protein n=1 Tax=Streptomyces virginiae TaxID=1961 RepID=UPI0036CEE7DC
MVQSEFAASLDARDPGRPAPSLPYIGDVPADPGLVLALTTTRAALEGSDEAVVLRAAGHEWEFHPSVRPALESPAPACPSVSSPSAPVSPWNSSQA